MAQLTYINDKNMAMFNKQDGTSQEIETIIGPSVTLEGNFVGSGDVVVEGSINGTLKTQGSVRVGKDAKIKAEVRAAQVYVAGEIRGNVFASSSLELASSARVVGNIQAKNLSIEAGATFQGKSSMDPIDEDGDKNKSSKQKETK